MLDSWQIGEIKVTRILEMEMPLPYRADTAFMPKATPEAIKKIDWLFPHYVTKEGFIKLAFQIFLVEAPGLRLVVDTCIGNDKPRHMLGGNSLQTSFLEHLATAGWSRESVDLVVCTHLHVDHVGWNTQLVDGKYVPTFPNASYLMGKQDLEFWGNVDEVTNVDFMKIQRTVFDECLKPILDAGLARPVEAPAPVCEGVSLIPTPVILLDIARFYSSQKDKLG